VIDAHKSSVGDDVERFLAPIVGMGSPAMSNCSAIAAGMIVCSADVAMPDSEAVAARRNMEQRFAARAPAIAAQ